MSSRLPSEIIEELAAHVFKAEGSNPEYLSIVEMSWDFLEERGYSLDAYTPDELDEIYEKVEQLCEERGADL